VSAATGSLDTARRLGLTERQMGLRVKRYGIDFKHFRREESTPSAA
jgi:transcriptional regulator with GAF, ATPase, and Fis domain